MAGERENGHCSNRHPWSWLATASAQRGPRRCQLLCKKHWLQLTHLELGHVDIGPEGAKALAAAIEGLHANGSHAPVWQLLQSKRSQGDCSCCRQQLTQPFPLSAKDVAIQVQRTVTCF
jgi:hypothetical protein